MNSRDPKLTALLFNEFINRQDIIGLAGLLTEEHMFINRDGKTVKDKVSMTKTRIELFKHFPGNYSTFNRIEFRVDFVIPLGHATWKIMLNQTMRYGRRE